MPTRSFRTVHSRCGGSYGHSVTSTNRRIAPGVPTRHSTSNICAMIARSLRSSVGYAECALKKRSAILQTLSGSQLHSCRWQVWSRRCARRRHEESGVHNKLRDRAGWLGSGHAYMRRFAQNLSPALPFCVGHAIGANCSGTSPSEPCLDFHFVLHQKSTCVATGAKCWT